LPRGVAEARIPWSASIFHAAPALAVSSSTTYWSMTPDMMRIFDPPGASDVAEAALTVFSRAEARAATVRWVAPRVAPTPGRRATRGSARRAGSSGAPLAVGLPQSGLGHMYT